MNKTGVIRAVGRTGRISPERRTTAPRGFVRIAEAMSGIGIEIGRVAVL